MSINNYSQIQNTVFPAGSSVPQALLRSADGILSAYGSSVPVDGTAGYAKGCIFHNINGAGNSVVYQNNGTAINSNFDVTDIAPNAYGTAAGKGPSPLVWQDVDILGLILDPTTGFYYFNDFMGEIDVTDGDGWTITKEATGTILGVPTLEGGAIIFDSAGFTAAHDGINAQLKNCMVKPQAGVKIYFEARVQMKNTGLDEYYIGLAGVLTDIIEQTSGLVDDTVDKCGFFRDAGAVPADDKLSTIISRTTVQSETADQATVADDTWVKLGFIIDGLDSVKFYVNGVLTTTDTTASSIPNAVMCLSFVSQVDQTATDAELTVDWVRVVQIGGRN